jgi:hypothetical protein
VRIAVVERSSTSAGSVVAATVADHINGAGHGPMETRLRRENWIAECGRRWEDMVARTFVRLP